MTTPFPPQGLYDPADEHDACGVGFIAAEDGRARREILDLAIEALGNLKHRGAVDADGKTGDGAGVMTQVPRAFLAARMILPPGELLGVGQMFIPPAATDAAQELVVTAARRLGFDSFAWRCVPTDPSVLGAKARATLPAVWQFVVGGSGDPQAFETSLYILRRSIERDSANAGMDDFYICSLSSRTIVYKGLFLAEQTAAFYPDLTDPAYVSNFALFHQRYSTNTAPAWTLAQPFRVLAHNGEINTLRGNLNWLKVHETQFAHPDLDAHMDLIRPVIRDAGSDSSALDRVFELLCRAGRAAPMAKSMLLPEAFLDDASMKQAHKDFYLYCNSVIEPWDGPAAIAACDGRWLLGGMDRNGLRPFRYAVTADGIVVAGSEAGLVRLDPARVIERGRLGPGQMIVLDLETGRRYSDAAIKDELAARQPYGDWVRHGTWLETLMERAKHKDDSRLAGKNLRQMQAMFGQTQEDIDLILRPMVLDAREATGSMGDDTPLAVLSAGYRPLHHFFRQNFAQVTNPPIDPLREKRVMSLYTRLGNFSNILEEDKRQLQMLAVRTPILTNAEVDALREFAADTCTALDTTFAIDAGPGALETALMRLREEAAAAVRGGARHLILADVEVGPARAAIPAVLATAAVHTHLLREGLRGRTSLTVRSAECIDIHYCAVLIGVGATLVNPWLTQETIGDALDCGLYGGKTTLTDCLASYKKAIGDGLLKVMSKMGIAVISSYRGGGNFEIIGLAKAMTDEYFPTIPSRIGGLSLGELATRLIAQHRKAYDDIGGDFLPPGGFYRLRASGERHNWDGAPIELLQTATARGDVAAYERYRDALARRPPLDLRDLLDYRMAEQPLSLDKVEAGDEIRKRFLTPAMSLGALSYEAHGTLNIAMNRIGARSNSGEGGEDPARYAKLPNGDNANSAVKQVASGRFGVTADYLNQCREIEIKIAQGAKPGEGGQLPGFKVTGMIARLRHATEGVTLISPPPHHDIYSIEDLAQLIYDLKQVNPTARVCVKLVAKAGIGTIAAGVVKAKADIIHIAGHAGGTGASPQTSIKFAGAPWELGLAEVNQVLVMNGLRDRVTLRTDGGIKSGRDIVIATLLGAEEFGIGTASLVALGCIMVRQCHSNTCPVGICTQDERLREMYTGGPDKVIALMDFLAGDVRQHLATLGFERLDAVIGRTDLLSQAKALEVLDLSPVLKPAGQPGASTRRTTTGRTEVPPTLDQEIESALYPLLTDRQRVELSYDVRNVHRAVGTYISGLLVRTFGADGLPADHLTLNLTGSAGQSLGAFGARGLKIVVAGEANDYAGKGLSGATIVVRPFAASCLDAAHNTIIGNTVLYGATSGRLYAAGQAGERFAVRNSGAVAVIEGCGSNGCEYMTGGCAVILGPVGANFAAGMTGGVAYLYAPDGDIAPRINEEFVAFHRLEADDAVLRAYLEAHALETGSRRAAEILADWPAQMQSFYKVAPKAAFQASSTTELLKTPMPSTDTSSLSPAFK